MPEITSRPAPPEAATWSDMTVFDAIFTPRATRIYQRRPVPEDLLTKVLLAATFACSSGNTQPWDFVVVTDDGLKGQLKKVMAEAFSLVDAQRAQTADQLIDGAGRSVTGHAAVENIDVVSAIIFAFWNPDRGIRLLGEYAENPDGTLRQTRDIASGRGSSLFPACQNMILAAQALGLSSLFTTFFGLAEREVKDILGVPARMFLESAVFVGYGDEDLKRPRRKPLAAVAHLNHWDTAYAGPEVAS
jgi:nitroreductase